jgi:hypothetical protein
VSRPTPQAQKAAAIGILEIALDGDKPVVFQLDGHAAVGGMTIHGTHGGDLTLCHSLFLLEASRCLSRRFYDVLNFVSSCGRINTLVAEDDYVVAEMVETGTWTGPLEFPGQSLPPTNRSYRIPMVEFIRFDSDGLIAEIRTYYDTASLTQQLGLDMNVFASV